MIRYGNRTRKIDSCKIAHTLQILNFGLYINTMTDKTLLKLLNFEIDRRVMH